MLGFINFYDIVFTDKYPEVSVILGRELLRIADQKESYELAWEFDESKAWDGLNPALQILDRVCPEASEWARNQEKSGKIVWTIDTSKKDILEGKSKENEDEYAKYEGGILTINSALFELKNSERACTIAHEFRHSRQNFSKKWKSACSVLLTGVRNDSIIEDDAYLFECRVRESIYGLDLDHGRR